MFNVLSENLKNSIRNEYKIRRWIVGLSLVFFVQICGLIFLSPSLVFSFFKEKEVQLDLRGIDGRVVATSTDSVLGTIPKINKTLKILDETLRYPTIIPLLSKILSEQTSKIHLTQFSFSTTNAFNSKISVSGKSDTRESLVSFVKALQNSGSFSSVDLPVSNLAKDRDINFSITLSVMQKK